MPQSNALVDHCLELLAPLGDARARRMFGGYGLTLDDLFIAIIAFDRLYLKADTQTRTRFADAGCEPFVYQARGKSMTMNYWTVPPQALESPDLMRPWARLALQAALGAQAARRSFLAGKVPRPTQARRRR